MVRTDFGKDHGSNGGMPDRKMAGFRSPDGPLVTPSQSGKETITTDGHVRDHGHPSGPPPRPTLTTTLHEKSTGRDEVLLRGPLLTSPEHRQA